MNKLAEKVQQALVKAINNDDLVLPTLPEVALNIRQAAEDPEISISHLSKVIGRDTALSARLIKVVNSPLLRATQEVTDLHTAITRLGTNYSSNLAIGLVMEQIFHARSETVEQKMRDVWRRSLEVGGRELCVVPQPQLSSSQTRQRPGRTGAPDRRAADPDLRRRPLRTAVGPGQPQPCHRQHPPGTGRQVATVAGTSRKCWPKLPGQYLNLERDSASLDYIDLVQIAVLYCHHGTDHPLAKVGCLATCRR